MSLKLEFPNEKHKEKYEKLIKEWGKIENLDNISPGALFYGSNFEEFLKEVNTVKNNPPKGFTYSSLFLLTDNNEILGGIDVRHDINHPNLIEKGGHIGYGIAPQYRRKGYATKMLELGLIEAKKLGLDKILITCNKDNIGSKKVIEKNGGIFERLTDDGKMRRYWINL
ncbi:MAG: GNAT family N-acetyltransferase [Candidatus Gracilibacteria bacterium]|nr:GNAT family N-acetyltransferase [Candidatus Gracilibacteria bacterium]